MLIRLVRKYLRPYWTWLSFVIGLQLVGTIALLYLPILNANIIDYGVSKGDIPYIIGTGIRMLLVSLCLIACSISANFFGARASMRLGRDLRAAYFRHVMILSGTEMAR